ncbi:isochorismatase family protein [Amycolatopsis sp. FDAARGOS 1241]|uniref:isochorismatase family protein n=1 Tax=Amycolatopsis sp. FDAARGOS 1241 TaxID=2778070 RepID=UPI00195077BC|nr:isochorismatase family protein [Amycolatopsis sp. FDAARGOS 1241]QRP47023.1 isochorismatase family protein [Amycolatopsis sp. FDAARGOS 1241]
MTLFDPASTALVLVDFQDRIVALPTTPFTGPEVAANAVRLRDAFSESGAQIVIIQVRRPGSEESPVIAELKPRAGEKLVIKTAIGGFYNTDLHAHLRDAGVRTVVFGGIATEFGVESTLRAAADFGYEVVAVSDAMTGLSDIAHESSTTKIFPRLGTVLTTAETLAALG